MSFLHEWHTHRYHFFGSPRPGALGEGPKGQNIIKSELQSQFQRFLNQTLCIFSQMKGIKHIRRDFHSTTWVIPRCGTLGYCGGLGGQKFFFFEIQPDFLCELLTCMTHAPAQFFGSRPPGALGRGQKFNILNMVMWHIKLTGMSSRPGYTENF